MIVNPRLVRAKRGVARRIFLKAVGLGVAAPIAFKLARFATAQPTAAPKRFFLFFMPHGVAPEHYNPRVSESDFTSFALDQTNLSILGPLEPYKQYVNVYEGFQYVGAADTHTGIVNCLSGATTSDTTTSRTTVEHVIAKELGVRPLILGACAHQPYGLDNNGMLFWDGTPIDPEKDPAKVADDLFGVAGSEPPPEVDPDVELRREILTLTASEIEAVSAELQGLTREQTKLAAHLDAIQKIQAAPGGGQSICDARPTLPTVEMVRAASAGQVIDPSGGNDYFYQERNFPLLFQAQLELATQALICNAAQVLALMPMYATCDFDFGFAGAPGSHHNGLSHATPQAAPGAQYDSPITVDNYMAAAREPFAVAQRWFATEFVERMVSVLANTDDPAAPGTTVLDNTLIYWMSEIGDGANHTRLSEVEYPQVPTSLPLVTIGKCAGAIKSGQVVRFPLDTHENAPLVNRPATDLYLTLARAMGVEASFPSTTGPVAEVLA
jgi:hypothetical protein